MKLMETEVTKKVYFVTSYEERYSKALEYENQIMRILFFYDKPVKAIFHALGFAGGIIPIEYYSDQAFKHVIVTPIFGEKYSENTPAVHYLEITAWESTWKRIEKLPWATVIEEAV